MLADGERAEVQEPFEGVVLVELELLDVLAGLHHRGVLEPVAEPERTVVMEVVAQEHVGRRRLGRGGLERGVRLDAGP